MISLTTPLRAETPFRLEEVSALFPSVGFEGKIAFWKSIFTTYSETQVLIHDITDPRIVYEVVTFDRTIHNDRSEARHQRRTLNQKRTQVQHALRTLQTSKRASLEPHQDKIRQMLLDLGYEVKPDLFRRLEGNIRIQRGIQEKFREGLIRSGRYLDRIEEIFSSHGLPTELAALPHVESSFQNGAYSKRGALGIWQFIRSTGRDYLKINSYLDERLDPLLASDAAARFLKSCFQELESWPLAITAFNYGKHGMKRAKSRYGKDLRDIIRQHRSRTFGFASKNFYAEFLAALEVSRNHQVHFGNITVSEPLDIVEIYLNQPVRLADLTRHEGITQSLLETHNPKILPTVWKRTKVLPEGLQLAVPRELSERLQQALQKAPATESPVFYSEDPMRYRVRSGDTLSEIAQRFGTSTGQLKRINDIRDGNQIQSGQVLLITADIDSDGRYRVRAGDTLEKIARRLGVRQTQLQTLNRIRNPHRIYRGQLLLIPSD